jgi:hypothetical protein
MEKKCIRFLTVDTVEIYVPEAVAKDIMLFQNRSMSMQIVGRVEAANTKTDNQQQYGTLNINIIRS